MPDPRVVVAAAVVERDSKYLVARRLRGTHLEGFWEFPGGKREDGESDAECLIREIREELGCDVTVGEELLSVAHDYPDRCIELHFFRCAVTGDPQPLLGQELRWIAPGELARLDFPPADAELIRLLTA